MRCLIVVLGMALCAAACGTVEPLMVENDSGAGGGGAGGAADGGATGSAGSTEEGGRGGTTGSAGATGTGGRGGTTGTGNVTGTGSAGTGGAGGGCPEGCPLGSTCVGGACACPSTCPLGSVCVAGAPNAHGGSACICTGAGQEVCAQGLDSSLYCIDTRSNAANCGACGQICTKTCSSGVCN